MTLKAKLWCTGIAALLVAVIAGLLLKFVVLGHTVPAADGRTAIMLNASERQVVLGEMRQFLAGIQTITGALAHDPVSRADLQTVATTARSLGTAASRGVPGSLMGKLPLGFKQLGLSVHRDFDQMARDAEDLGDPKHTLNQLSATLNKCVACHAAYQIPGPVPGPAAGGER
ncbi:MAG: hypothetical protein P8009_07240 [Gammaproteobacteria bacterium]